MPTSVIHHFEFLARSSRLLDAEILTDEEPKRLAQKLVFPRKLSEASLKLLVKQTEVNEQQLHYLPEDQSFELSQAHKIYPHVLYVLWMNIFCRYFVLILSAIA